MTDKSTKLCLFWLSFIHFPTYHFCVGNISRFYDKIYFFDIPQRSCMCHLLFHPINFLQCLNYLPCLIIRLFQLILTKPRFGLNEWMVPLQKGACSIIFLTKLKGIIFLTSSRKPHLVKRLKVMILYECCQNSLLTCTTDVLEYWIWCQFFPNIPSKKGMKSFW